MTGRRSGSSAALSAATGANSEASSRERKDTAGRKKALVNHDAAVHDLNVQSRRAANKVKVFEGMHGLAISAMHHITRYASPTPLHWGGLGAVHRSRGGVVAVWTPGGCPVTSKAMPARRRMRTQAHEIAGSPGSRNTSHAIV